MTPLTTVTLDADAETLLREHGVMVVDADPISAMYHRIHNGDHDLAPPSWAVAATEPCETCGGNFEWVEPIPTPSGGREFPTTCDYCHAGRPVIEVIVNGRSTFWTVGEVGPIVDRYALAGCEQVTR